MYSTVWYFLFFVILELFDSVVFFVFCDFFKYSSVVFFVFRDYGTIRQFAIFWYFRDFGINLTVWYFHLIVLSFRHR